MVRHRYGGIAFSAILGVGHDQFVAIDRGLRGAHSTVRFEKGHATGEHRIREPIARGHRRVVVHDRGIADNDDTGAVAQHHLEVGSRRAAEQIGDCGDVFGRGALHAEGVYEDGRQGAAATVIGVSPGTGA